jgi:hypothetical protein
MKALKRRISDQQSSVRCPIITELKNYEIIANTDAMSKIFFIQQIPKPLQ